LFFDAQRSNLLIGGNHGSFSGSGDIFLFNQNVSDITNAALEDATIRIDGGRGDIILRNADCAEEFDIFDNEDIEPGDVLILDDHEDKLRKSNTSYDKRVAGVYSGAGNHKPGIILDKRNSGYRRVPVALVGKVHCRVIAESDNPIQKGDLLTTSDIPGCAMKAVDPLKAFGTVIGKALQSIKSGKGLIPIIVNLQ